INSDLDTVNLLNSLDKYILLETWNETCLPCIKAMKELPDFYKSMQSKMETYYLYENSNERVRKKFDKIFNFKNIKDKTKILIDINEELYKGLNMKGFPYFLLFDSQGNLIYHSRGYIGKEILSKQILEHIQS
ncbi:MAG: TlpA family protein disulfide reductase, partial [Saprospiraceae bacterium]